MTSNRAGTESGVMLSGLDGSNPLAFLAALGTLRTLILARPTRSVRLGWSEHAGAGRPVILSDGERNQHDCVKALEAQRKKVDGHLALSPDDNLGIEPDRVRPFARKCVHAGDQTSGTDGRTPGVPWTQSYVSRRWPQILDEAGVEYAKPHDLRKSASTALAVAVADVHQRITRGVTGHASSQGLEKYYQLAQVDALRAAVNKASAPLPRALGEGA